MFYRRFDDTELDRERIAIKMATITSEKPITPLQILSRPIYEIYENIRMDQQPAASIYSSYPKLFQSLKNAGGTTQLRRRFRREAKCTDEGGHNSINGQNTEIKYKNNMEKPKPQNRDTKSNGENRKKSNDHVDPEARIDLTNKLVEREAEELFNIDTMFWRSLGFEESSFKRYSLAYCTKGKSLISTHLISCKRRRTNKFHSFLFSRQNMSRIPFLDL